jgi:antitoxin (DNA-binding transcriptional repressor) of toxin-antitoxin stability system
VAVEPPAGGLATVRIGAYSADVGGRSGSFAQFEPEPEDENASAVAEALGEAPDERPKPIAAIEDFQQTADAVTGRIEKAESLLKAADQGQLLAIGNLSGEIDSLLDLFGRLDQAGRFEEELRLMRSLNGLLALTLRWLDLIRSLWALLESAEKAHDVAGQAFAHHELGTLHLCAGQAGKAAEHLGAAARLQTTIGDLGVHCATRHNLDSAQRDLASGPRIPRPRRFHRLAVLGGAFAIAAGSGAGIALAVHGRHSHHLPAGPAAQSITVTTHAPATAAYRAQFTVAATGGGSGKPVVYSSSGHCTNRGATFTMTGSSGTCTVTYDQAGNRRYTAARRLTETVDAAKAGQSITVTTHAPATAAYGSRFTVAAVDAGSGKPIVYLSRGVCTNRGATFTMTSASGTCTVEYHQAGNRNYKSAHKAETVNAIKAGQSIKVTTHAPGVAVLDSQFTVAATGGRSGNPIVYSSSGACTRSGAAFTIASASGVCTVKYDQAGNGNYNPASGVIETVNATAAIGGFQFPAANSAVPYASGAFIVRLVLTDAFGKPLTSAQAAPLIAAADISVALTGPNGSAQVAATPCQKNKSQFFLCTLQLPTGLATGPANAYTLTASQTAGGGSVVLPTYAKAPATDANPETFFFQ